MGKQLEFTAKEQRTIVKAIMKVNEILLLKMDEGVDAPTFDGEMDVANEDKKVVFSFEAKKSSE